MVISPPKLLITTTDTHFPHFRSIESEERREARGEKPRREKERRRAREESRGSRYNSGGNFDLLGIYSSLDQVIGVRYRI
ncbi:hypothetical protein Sjap_002464 [Stephania japonica]|uniref:Uncharacterized protein n=1 Tax=Stephania japonica TaxID=461633 RepID=A0AAP0KNP6_9MAGN